MGGCTSRYVDEVADAPLDFETPIDTRDPSVVYVRGGLIPTGQRFVVTSFSYEGFGGGDSNGHGEAIFSIAGEEVARAESGEGHVSDAWSQGGDADTMPFMIRSGDEASTYIEVANSNWARLVIEGRLEEDPMDGPVPFGAGNSGFLAFPPPVPVPAVPDLEAPRAELRVKNLRGGGNPHTIDLLGRPSMYIDSTETSLEEYRRPLGPRTRSRALAIGGSVPEGQCFIVTAATLTGSWSEGARERDYARVMLGREEIIELSGSTGPFRSEWHGTLHIERGEEFRLRLEIADNAEAEVVIEGRFESVGR